MGLHITTDDFRSKRLCSNKSAVCKQWVDGAMRNAMLLSVKTEMEGRQTISTDGRAHLELPFVLSNVLPHLLLHLLCPIYPLTQGLSECLSVKGFIAQVSALNTIVRILLSFLLFDSQTCHQISSTKMTLDRHSPHMSLCAAKALLPCNLQLVN